MGQRKGRDDISKSANLYARIEPDVKEQAEEILATLGSWHLMLSICFISRSF